MAHSYGAGCWQETTVPAIWAICGQLDYPYNMAPNFHQTGESKREGKADIMMSFFT